MVSDKPRTKQRQELRQPKTNDANQHIKEKGACGFSALLLFLTFKNEPI